METQSHENVTQLRQTCKRSNGTNKTQNFPERNEINVQSPVCVNSLIVRCQGELYPVCTDQPPLQHIAWVKI